MRKQWCAIFFWLISPLLCPELSWMAGHAKAVVTSRGRCPVRQECWDVTSWQEGVEALVVSRALLGRSGDGAERFTWLCFQMTSRGNIIVEAFQEGSVWSWLKSFLAFLYNLPESLKALLGGSSVDSPEEECCAELDLPRSLPTHWTLLLVPCSCCLRKRWDFNTSSLVWRVICSTSRQLSVTYNQF